MTNDNDRPLVHVMAQEQWERIAAVVRAAIVLNGHDGYVHLTDYRKALDALTADDIEAVSE